jgi:hypothetical protein
VAVIARWSVVAAVVLSLLTPETAAAETLAGDADPVQAYVDAAMLAQPGGEQTGPGEVTWGGGAAVLTVDIGAASRAVGTCATDNICVYSATGLTGSKLAFTGCSSWSTAGLAAPVRSMVNARGAGYARGFGTAASALTTLAPGVSNNFAPAGITRVTCSA